MVVGHLSERLLKWCNIHIRGRANLPFPARLKPQKWLYLAKSFLTPAPRGVAAHVQGSDDKTKITLLILGRGVLSSNCWLPFFSVMSQPRKRLPHYTIPCIMMILYFVKQFSSRQRPISDLWFMLPVKVWLFSTWDVFCALLSASCWSFDYNIMMIWPLLLFILSSDFQ